MKSLLDEVIGKYGEYAGGERREIGEPSMQPPAEIRGREDDARKRYSHHQERRNIRKKDMHRHTIRHPPTNASYLR